MCDEKKLIEYLKTRAEESKREWERFDDHGAFGEYHAFSSVIDCVNSMPKVAEWTPCSERLPEEDYDTVLVWLDTKIYDIAIWNHEYGFRPWYAAHFMEATPEWKGKVVAWQPLPEPYRGEEE